MKDRLEEIMDLKNQNEIQMYIKRICETSGDELSIVLKEVQERMEKELDVESSLLLFVEISSLLNEKKRGLRYLTVNCFFSSTKMPLYANQSI